MKGGAYLGGLYVAICLIPFLFIGEMYGMVWFELNMPLSNSVERSIGLSENTWPLNLLITLINAAIISCIFGGIFYGIHQIKKKRRSQP